MGVRIPAIIECNVCGKFTELGHVVVTKVQPTLAGYVAAPPGWTAQTHQFSGELFLQCPICSEKDLAMPTPFVLNPAELAEIRAKLPPKKG
jgi:hypothetical protein